MFARRREEKEESGHRVTVHDIHDRRWMLRAFVSKPQTPWAGCVFSSSRSDTMCILLW